VRGEEFRVLAEEQAALRRVATLVARGASPEGVFAALTNEVAGLFGVDVTNLCRYEYDGTYTIIASAGKGFLVGRRWALGGHNGTTQVFETGRPARIDSYATASGQGGIASRELGIRSSVGAPIVVGAQAAGRSRNARLASLSVRDPAGVKRPEAPGDRDRAGGDREQHDQSSGRLRGTRRQLIHEEQ
jgi:GAF domain-containing protein